MTDSPQTWAEFFGPIDGVSDNDKTILIRRYVRESNEIENIHRTPSRREIAAHVAILQADEVSIGLLAQFVNSVQPGAKLRLGAGMNVTVGDHTPPPGGMAVAYKLEGLLATINEDEADPYLTHIAYEDLHPFTDGNGRSGRALWLRMAGPQALAKCFLTNFYYETLRRSRQKG